MSVISGYTAAGAPFISISRSVDYLLGCHTHHTALPTLLRTPLRTVRLRSLSSFLGRRYVYFCAVCQKVLGVSHRKGFWMG